MKDSTMHKGMARVIAAMGILCLAMLATGCATSGLNAARRNFYQGNLDRAAANLDDIPDDKTNRVLLLMERGMIRQVRGDYEASIDDWLAAAALIEELDYLSVSRASASMVINDRVQAFRGAPYERMLMRAFTAKSFFALSRWDDAAVEARNIIYQAERLDGFPDSAYWRYLSGFCMELIRDGDAAARQYRQADALAPAVSIGPDTGRITPRRANPAAGPARDAGADPEPELIVFLAIGSAPDEYERRHGIRRWGSHPHAEIYSDNRYLGRSYTLSDTRSLVSATQKRLETLRAAKTAGRLALKEAAALAVESKDEALGELVRMILYALETVGERRWETLPMFLQVARVPCPADLDSYRIVVKGLADRPVVEKTITTPIMRRGNTFVSFLRVW